MFSVYSPVLLPIFLKLVECVYTYILYISAANHNANELLGHKTSFANPDMNFVGINVQFLSVAYLLQNI